LKVLLLSVGKPKDPRLAALHDDYAGRIRRFGVTYETAWVPEVESGRRFSSEHAKEREGRSILEVVDPRGSIVALDPSGDALSSEAFARRLEAWSAPRVTFVVGGPIGLHRDVLRAAARTWSLTPLTFPHELVRVLVAEQVYRALTLLRGVPYHK
jgi:23S rRNA (pseudouridine1915-N3)-methyltransferase